MPSIRAAAFGTTRWLGRFRAGQDGSMSYFAVTGALIMMVFGGIGVDMIHAELKRTKLQNTLDRAVLAAAALENDQDAAFTVEDYFRAMNMSDTLTSVAVEQGLNFKTVTAEAHATLPSQFMDLIGVHNMQAAGRARAEEGMNKIEVSLVLDISGSMANNSKMANLKTAAGTFFDTLLRDDTQDLVSVSLIPYSEHVNAGPLITEHLNVDWKHGYSHCLEMPDSAFGSTVLDTAMTYDQMQHFQWNYSGANDLTDTVCPQYSYERITPFSQDAAALKAQVNQFRPRAGTSIFLGMKWASALLDPSTRFIADDLIADGNMDAVFAGRPVAYDDTETIKTVVLMTDGQHDKSHRIQDWAYNSSSEIQLFANNNLWYYLVRNVGSYAWGNFYYQKYDAATGDRLLDSICGAAKAQGVVIWTIGLEVTDHGADVMERCASSPSHFFRVSGTAIEDAFHAIARTINQLRLTQ